MYASTWICTKTQDLSRPNTNRKMSTLSLGDSAIIGDKLPSSVENLLI